MKKEDESSECCNKKMFFKHHHGHHGGDSNAIYGLGVIGALFYFLQGAHNVGTILLGIGKSIFWPAILMFKLLTYLHL